MRPRHKAAENAMVRDVDAHHLVASMRPRHKAAENGKVFFTLTEDDDGLQ